MESMKKKNQENDDENKSCSPDRRRFCSTLTFAAGSVLLVPQSVSVFNLPGMRENPINPAGHPKGVEKSIIGPYGPWLSSLRNDQPGGWSFRHRDYADTGDWRKKILPKVRELIAVPSAIEDYRPVVRTTAEYDYDGLHIEELEWSWPYGHPTRAVLLKPRDVTGPLPAILGLHDHGGNKYFGYRKIVRTGAKSHPLMTAHRKQYYEGRAWANEIAKRGYVVLVHDVFTFGSRRVRFEEMTEIPYGEVSTRGKTDDRPEEPENIEIYNRWASAHEHVMAKSLFSGGTTWPAMYLAEDRAALGILADREEVDPDRIGIAGLSGGGLRSVYLTGIDHRVACAVCVGFMTTWDDFMLHRSYTHTWMTYTPVLPAHLEFPEIMCLRMPRPVMIQNDVEDGLFTLPEMEKAAQILEENYRKAGAEEKVSCRFYPGPHKFDAAMQKDAFDWFDRWLAG